LPPKYYANKRDAGLMHDPEKWTPVFRFSEPTGTIIRAAIVLCTGRTAIRSDQPMLT
jgi:hypothetical protein